LPPVVDADVDRVLGDLQERQAILTQVERPAQIGDQVFIRLSGNRLEPEEGESAVLVTDRPMPVTIARSDAIAPTEWPFPGFSQYLVNLSTGDQKSITHTFQEDADYTSLRGKSAEFTFTIESVKSRTLPELNDEFAHSTGEYETIDALRADIRASLESEREEDYEEGYNDKVMDELFKLATWKYPPQMLDHEIELFMDQLGNRLAQQNIDMATYLKIRQLDEAGLKEEIAPLAEKRMKRTMLLLEIAQQQGIKVNEEELETESMRTMERLSQMIPPDKARKTMTDQFVQNMIGNIGADLLIKHTWDYLHAITKGEEVLPGKIEPSIEEPQPETI